MATATFGRGIEALHRELEAVFGKRLKTFALYGPHLPPDGRIPDEKPAGGLLPHSLALVESLDAADLSACARLNEGWHKRGVPVPLLMPAGEFRRSLDAFPLEYGEILARHVVVAGDNPFDGLEVDAQDIRRALEVQVKSHLIHLRQGYLESGARPPAIAGLVVASATPLRAVLTHMARLDGAAAETLDAVVRYAAERIGLEPGPLRQVLGATESSSLGGAEAEQLYPSYLAGIVRLAEYVDAWRNRTTDSR